MVDVQWGGGNACFWVHLQFLVGFFSLSFNSQIRFHYDVINISDIEYRYFFHKYSYMYMFFLYFVLGICSSFQPLLCDKQNVIRRHFFYNKSYSAGYDNLHHNITECSQIDARSSIQDMKSRLHDVRNTSRIISSAIDVDCMSNVRDNMSNPVDY